MHLVIEDNAVNYNPRTSNLTKQTFQINRCLVFVYISFYFMTAVEVAVTDS